MNAMSPANKDIYSSQPHQDGIPVVVMAQERGNEEGEEDGDRPRKKQPGETHLLVRNTSEHQHFHFRNVGSVIEHHCRGDQNKPSLIGSHKNYLLHANICQNRQWNSQAQRQSSNQGRCEKTAPVKAKTQSVSF